MVTGKELLENGKIIAYDANGRKLIYETDNIKTINEARQFLYNQGKMDIGEIASAKYCIMVMNDGIPEIYSLYREDITDATSKDTNSTAYFAVDQLGTRIKLDFKDDDSNRDKQSLLFNTNNGDEVELLVRYHHEKYGEFNHINKFDKGDFIDLRCAQHTIIEPGTSGLVPLGISVQIPHGYYMELVPRSSTFKNFHILQFNSIGIIDESYCGDDDLLFFPAFNPLTKPENVYAEINVNDRICQFRLVKKTNVKITEVDKLSNVNRGGFGSTGKN